MEEYRTKEGPYPVRLVYETKEIDQICEDALRSVKLLPTTPESVKIDRFLEKYFEVRVVYDDLGEGAMGCTVFNHKGRVTGFFVSSRIEEDATKAAERRVRSTLAHEGGHGLLHPKLFIADETPSLFGEKKEAASRILCRAADVGAVKGKVPYNGRWWEWQANRAIAGLLLPRKLVSQALQGLLDRQKLAATLPESRRREAEKLAAETFDVNSAVTRIRLEEMFPTHGQIEL